MILSALGDVVQVTLVRVVGLLSCQQELLGEELAVLFDWHYLAFSMEVVNAGGHIAACDQSCGAALFLVALAPATAPAPGQFQKAINQKLKVIILFIKNEKNNVSLAWTEHLLKRNLNSLSYFEKICWL